jgi:separase
MPTITSPADVVRKALATPTTCPPTTSATLQSLLTPAHDHDAKPTKTPIKSTTSTRKPAPTRAARSKPTVGAVAPDAIKALSSQERHKLATQVVNVSLKVLTDAAKTRSVSPSSSPNTEAGLTTVAECARIAFSHLRSARSSTDESLQLETGMLALSSRLVALGMDTLAMKELRILKSLLHKRSEGVSPPPPSDKETLATLLQLDCHTNDPSVISLAISYHLSILRLIVNARRPATVEASLPHLLLDNDISPASLLLRSADLSKDKAKAAGQLDTLSKTILSMCPSPSTSADSLVESNKAYPSPDIVFRLQTTALLIQTKWWPLAGHKENLQKELHDPLIRYLDAYRRRATHREPRAYKSAIECVESLVGSTTAGTSLPPALSKYLSAFAESFNMQEEALQFVEILSMSSGHASNHTTRLSHTLRSIALRLDGNDPSDLQLIREQSRFCEVVLASTAKPSPATVDETLQELTRLRKTALKQLTLGSEKLNGSEIDEYLLGLCKIAFLCTEILTWCFSCDFKEDAHKAVAFKLVVPFVSSSIFACRLLVSSCDHIGTIQQAFQICTQLLDIKPDPEAEHLFVHISNLYWRCFQTLTLGLDEPSTQAVQCLEVSIDLLRDRASIHQETGFLTAKLEKFGNITKSPTLFAESVRLHIRSGVLRELAQDARSRPLSTALIAHPKAQLLERNLREYHTVATKDDGHASFLDDKTIDLLERAILLELQLAFFEEDLVKPSHRRRVTADLQKLCGIILGIYSEIDHPLRRARICSWILRYSNEYSDLIDIGITEQALGGKVGLGQFGQDDGLKAYASYLRASLSLSQALYADNVPVEVIIESIQELSDLLRPLENWDLIMARVDNVEALLLDLRFTASFLATKGKEDSRLEALRLLSHVVHLRPNIGTSSVLQISSQLALQFMHSGYSFEACRIIEQEDALSTKSSVSILAKLEWFLAKSEIWTTLGQTELSASSMASAADSMLLFPTVDDATKAQAQIIRARYAYVCSMFSKSIGQVKQAMIHARRYVMLCQQTLDFLERQHAPQTPSLLVPRPTSPEGLAKAIDALTISASESGAVSKPHHIAVRGAALAAIVPDLLNSFLHLSEMYAHQGMRSEALYYLNQADKAVSKVDAHELRTRVLVQREAQAHIGGVETACPVDPIDVVDSIDMVKLGITRGDMFADDEETWENAHAAYEKAESMAIRLASKSFNEQIEALKTQPAKAPVHKTATTRTTTRAVSKAPAPKSLPAKKAVKPIIVRSKTVASTKTSSQRNIPLSSLCAAALRQRGLLLINQGETDLGLELLKRAEDMKYDSTQDILQHIAMSEGLLRKFGDELALDFTFNVLPESTISFPALSTATGRKPSASSTPLSIVNTTTPKKNGRQKRTDDDFARFLCEAQERILSIQRRSTCTAGMSVFHQLCGLSSKAMLLLSAIDASMSSTPLHPTRAACAIELPRIEAISREMSTVEAEKGYSNHNLALQLVTQSSDSHLSAARFQKEYVDIIPNDWTAVSITLSEDHNELCIARYRANKAPFLLRLPMTRNKMQDIEDSEESPAFDFESGKAELQEIIELSNYSCSKPPSAMTAEAKQSWWNEREALDLRMQELVVNIENIWLGGFKGILSQHRKNTGLLARFRKSFDGILDRHLPSRQGAKGKPKRLVLDINILELFVGLGDDLDGEVDMDEQVLDLLYFVVDILQFNGERNAYDEVDFDIMATETMDALRSYHEATSVNEAGQTHLILILDRKLHAFPWETLPCLQSVSVSRVGSMLTLRERILVMRRQMNGSSEEKYFIDKQCGSSILNPSGDLSRTQSTMAPLLESLAKPSGSSWHAITNHMPKEKEFAAALSEKDMVLYFGHGSGNQYISNRTIKKLDKCAAVVWLMGCSSGSVTEYGDYEPTSVPLSYLIAGKRIEADKTTLEDDRTSQRNDNRQGLCMAVVATLWDVTDKDIDRFSVKLGDHWGLWDSVASADAAVSNTLTKDLGLPKTPRKRGRSVPKTPSKTPARTPGGGAGAVGRSRSRLVMRDGDDDNEHEGAKDGRKKSLVEAVVLSREACHLRFLNGAATVVYGLPVYLCD